MTSPAERLSPPRAAGKLATAAALAAAVFFCGCPQTRPAESLEWTTMGTVASVKTRGGGVRAVQETTAKVFANVEKLLNAHDPESELARLAGLPDGRILASCDPSVRECYAEAFKFRDETGGRFNPRWRGPGTMDLGAIAKGFALDRAAEEAGKTYGGEALLDLGGNLKCVRGEWRVAIYGSAGGETIVLKDGEAAATSGEYFRGRHIADGTTGEALPAAGRAVTVVHPSSATAADALSTVLFILGPGEGGEFLKEKHPGARAVWTEIAPPAGAE